MIALLLCVMFTAKAQLSSVKVYVEPHSQDRLEVIDLLQLEHFMDEDGYIQAEIDQAHLKKLKASRFKYKILIPNITEYLKAVNKPYYEGRQNGTINMDGTLTAKGKAARVAFERPGDLLDNVIFTPTAFQVWGTLGGYYSYAQMVTAVENLYNTYSPLGLVDTFHVGLSVEGRMIYAIKISDNVNSDENEPECFFQGVQHAREAIGGSSMIFMMQYLCQAYTQGNSRIVDLVNNREIFFIPIMNVDGWEYNRSQSPNGGGDWRKNRKMIGSGQYGVDLNRNWSTDWANCSGAVGGTSCGSGTIDTDNDTYWGASAFSEPETQAVRNFIRARHIVVANDQHSVGPYYSLPFGRPNLHRVPDSLTAMDQQWYVRIPALMGKFNGMRAGNSMQALGYEVAGGVKDWFLRGDIGTGVGSGMKTKIYGMTGEGGYRAAASTFWPPAAEIITLCKGMTYQNIQMIYSAGSYVDFDDQTDIALTSRTGTLSFRVKRIGLLDEQVTVTLFPLTNVSSVGAPVVINSLPTYYQTYTGNISYTIPASVANGQHVRFVWRIQTGGQTYYDTVTKFYTPTQLMFDNMETGNATTNWTISSGWAYAADSGYGATRAFTESPNAAYPANITAAAPRTALFRTNLNLSDATAAYITMWVRHKAENFRDKLQVQVSPDGTTWTAVGGKTTIREPGTLEGTTINGQPSLTGIRDDWTREVFDISAFNGTPALRLRLAFTSNASSTFYAAQDAGFFIDDIKVIKSTIPQVVLPVHFISFTAKLTTDNNVVLEWKAEVDSKHSHFIVERSTDGQNYVPIGRVDDLPYRLTDYNPVIGLNYYRIKQYDIDGQFAYSKINTIYFNPDRLSLIVYPNPAEEDVTLRFNVQKTETITIRITNLAGHVVYQNKAVINGSNQEVKIHVKDWPAQTYIVKAIRADNSSLTIQKLIKQ